MINFLTCSKIKISSGIWDIKPYLYSQFQIMIKSLAYLGYEIHDGWEKTKI